MSTDKQTLKEYIKQQENFYNAITGANHNLKNKIMTYTGTILALLAFLYSGALDEKKSVLQKLFIPEELYGKIFYAVGLFLVLYAFGKLLKGARPNGRWHMGFASDDVKLVENMKEEDYLKKLKDDNDEALDCDLKEYNSRFVAIKDSFYPMVIGGIILVVLRYFQ